ncbi:hypothetical protein KIN20_029127 [Parelaphostrongylus tenuis]|uniref:Uncharacterized protein n=1 Tax=Parelaphostrongylus tenuis TaxID=148309 RepID=A0AAD5R2N7_PARTN|nr:hypothetical protein KIN20_029127 [Parelaphostrongylus tenuis]
MSAKADEERRRLKSNTLQQPQNTSLPQPHMQTLQHQPPSIVHKVMNDGNTIVPEKIYRNHADAPIRKLTCDLIKTYKNINESFYLRKALRRQEHQANIQTNHNPTSTATAINNQLSGTGPHHAGDTWKCSKSLDGGGPGCTAAFCT